MSDSYIEPEVSSVLIGTSADIPGSFEVPNDKSILVPSSIIEAARKAHAEAKFPSYPLVAVSSTDLIEGDMTDGEIKKIAEAPFTIKAADGCLYVTDNELKDPNYPDVPLQILRLDYDAVTGKIIRVHRDADESVFRQLLYGFPKNTLIGKLQEALQIEHPTQQDAEKRKKIKMEAEDTYSTLQELQELSDKNGSLIPNTLTELPENISNIHQIHQGEYCVTSNREAVWLATYGAGPCYIVSVYDREGKKGALTHIDGTTDGEKTIDLMANALIPNGISTKTNVPRFQVTISGGERSSGADIVKSYKRIIDWQKKYSGNIEIIITNLFGQDSESLALNLNTGEIMHFNPSPALNTRNYDLDKLKLYSRAFSGRKSPASFVPPKSIDF